MTLKGALGYKRRLPARYCSITNVLLARYKRVRSFSCHLLLCNRFLSRDQHSRQDYERFVKVDWSLRAMWLCLQAIVHSRRCRKTNISFIGWRCPGSCLAILVFLGWMLLRWDNLSSEIIFCKFENWPYLKIDDAKCMYS